MQRTQTRLRIGFGLVAMVAVLALVAFMTMVSSNGGTTSVSATGPTPTTEPNPGTDGFLSGVQDLEVLPGPNAIYHCISRTDHDGTSNRVKTSTQCYIDVPGTGDPANILAGVNVPGEGPDILSGPPPPPPYTTQQPNIGVGEYFPGGNADCTAIDPLSTTCLIVITCFPDIGAGSLGPNLLTKLVVPDPTGVSDAGTVDLATGVTNKQCDAHDASVFPSGVPPLAIGLFDPAAAPTGWRTAAGSATDFDGDACSDLDELDSKARPKGCGDDPYNPLDSNVTDFTGAYAIGVRVLRAGATPGFGGIYFNCLADIQQNGNGKTDGDLVARPFCYTDGFAPTQVVNQLGYPGVTGDGFPGGSPPFGAIPAVGPPETNCARGLAGSSLDEDGDGTANDGCPSEGFGDLDSKHTVLTGFVDNANNLLKLRGCFNDEDASSSVGIVYVEAQIQMYTGIGTVDIWTEQTAANCTAGAAFGSYVGDGGAPGPIPIGAFNDARIVVVRQPGGKLRDTDQDGIPDAVELRDNGTTDCGLRDPFNPYDWYDVNQDGVIDLLNDILGVISHYQPAPGGAPPYDANWDRPPSMTGGIGHWNRGAPDGVIDLLNDILGVISQYHPGPC